jgi:molybdenum cofactor cytidylyltransferase
MTSFAIVPAAGRSQRMGRPKLLLPWRDATVIEATLAAWQAGSVTKTIVVVHPEDMELAELCRGHSADVVVADVPPPDMKASVLLGLQFVRQQLRPDKDDVWLVAPADMPTLSSAVIRRLLAEHRSDDPAILLPVHAGKRGHPVLLPWSAADEVERLPADAGLDHLTRGPAVRTVDCPEIEAASDLDTPDDYRQLHNRHNP